MCRAATSVLLLSVAIVSGSLAIPAAEPPPLSSGPEGPYLGQAPPGLTAKLFAPGFINTGMYTRDVAMTPDGKELYFGLAVGGYAWSTICVTRLASGRWTPPEVVPGLDDPRYMNFEPCISPDGKQFFFLSNRPDTATGEKEGDQDIWVMDRAGDGWTQPRNLGAPVNSDRPEYFPSVTRDGTLYFTREEKDSKTSLIYRSRLLDGRYQEPEKLPAQVNCGSSQFNAFVAPDESYVIVPVLGRKDTLGSVDYYIVFRAPDDTWSDPVNLGPAVNTAGGGEYSPYVSRDGKYFFFMSGRFLPKELWPAKLTYARMREVHGAAPNGSSAIYWIDASFLETLRPKASRPVEPAR